jgi:O-antigen/teichoic acid export membrane protein
MARGAAVNLLGSVAGSGLGLVVTLVITHMASAGAIGLVAIASTVVGFAVILALFGLDTGVIRFVALGASVGDQRAARAGLQVGIVFTTLASGLLTGIIWWKAPWLAHQVFHKPEATDIIRIVALSLPPIALSRVVMAGIRGYGIMEYSAWLGILRRLVQLASVVPLLALGLAARGLAISAVLTAAASATLSVIFLLRVHSKALIPAPRAWPVFRLLNFSAPQVLTAALFFAMMWTNIVLLARFGTAREVGIYSIIGTLLGPATLVSTAVGEMFAPRIAAEDGRGDRAALGRMLKRVTHWNTATSIPFFAALVIVPAPLLGLFGSTYREGATALAILAVGQLLNTAAGPLGQIINMTGRQYLSATNNALIAALNFGAAWVLIPRYGMTGAAASTASALTLVNLIKLAEVRILFRLHPFREDSVRPLLAAAIAAAITVPLSMFMDGPSPLVEVLAVGPLLFASYAAAIWALGVSDEDRELFALGRARLGRRLGIFLKR